MPRKWRTLLWAMPFWQPVTDLWAKTTKLPVVGKLVRVPLNDQHYDVTFIPINQELEHGDSTVIPREIVAEVIRRACHRVIIPMCLCRMGCRCQDYPMELGCLFLGESARDIDPSLGKAVSEEEALAHMDRSIEAGLIPQIGRVDPDPFMLGVKNWDRFLTLCFCCTCCCIAMRNMPSWSPRVKERMHSLEGLNIEITDDCNQCGKCVVGCFAHAIEMDGNRVRVTDACKGCGICASVCPQDAIKINVSDGDLMLQEVYRRIESYADIT